MRHPLFAACLAVLAASPLAAQETPPLEFQPIWENCGGHHGRELLDSFSADGKRAYFGAEVKKELVERDTATWKRTGKVLPLPEKRPFEREGTRHVSPDGKLGAFATSVRDSQGRDVTGRITFFDPATGKEIVSVEEHRQAPILRFSPDGKTLASAGENGILLWDTQKFRRLHHLKGTAGRPFSMVFSPDGKTLAANANLGAYPGEVEIWDTATGKLRLALGGHGAQVWRAAFSPDGKQLATTGNDPKLRFWDPATGMNVFTVAIDIAHHMPGLAWSPDGTLLAVGDGPLVRLFDARDYKQVAELKGHTASVESLAFRKDGKQLAAGSRGVQWIRDMPTTLPGELILWDVPSRKPAHVIYYHPNGVQSLAYSPDGKTLASGGGAQLGGIENNERAPEPDGAIALWDTTTGKRVQSFTVDMKHHVSAMAYSPDGTLLAHNAADGSAIRLLDAKTGKTVRDLHARNTPAEIAFSKDGKRLIAGGTSGGLDNGKGFVALFDVASGKLLAERVAHEQGINTVAFDPTGETVVTGGGDSVLWRWRIAAPKKAK